eukprot:31526-Pelagococcus_subviridis.AAC.2
MYTPHAGGGETEDEQEKKRKNCAVANRPHTVAVAAICGSRVARAVAAEDVDVVVVIRRGGESEPTPRHRRLLHPRVVDRVIPLDVVHRDFRSRGRVVRLAAHDEDGSVGERRHGFIAARVLHAGDVIPRVFGVRRVQGEDVVVERVREPRAGVVVVSADDENFVPARGARDVAALLRDVRRERPARAVVRRDFHGLERAVGAGPSADDVELAVGRRRAVIGPSGLQSAARGPRVGRDVVDVRRRSHGVGRALSAHDVNLPVHERGAVPIANGRERGAGGPHFREGVVDVDLGLHCAGSRRAVEASDEIATLSDS